MVQETDIIRMRLSDVLKGAKGRELRIALYAMAKRLEWLEKQVDDLQEQIENGSGEQ